MSLDKKHRLRLWDMKPELNFSSKDSATGLTSHSKKKLLHLVRDRRVYLIRVFYLQTTPHINRRTLWHTRRQRRFLNTRLQIRRVTQLHTRLQTHPLNLRQIRRFSPRNHEKIQLV